VTLKSVAKVSEAMTAVLEKSSNFATG